MTTLEEVDEKLKHGKHSELTILSIKDRRVRIKLLYGCGDAKTMTKEWYKMSQDGVGNWENIYLVDDDKSRIDYWIIINCASPTDVYDKSKSIILHMEPYIESKPQQWGDWSSPQGFAKVMSHSSSPNVIEWHLGLSYNELSTPFRNLKKEDHLISTILSTKDWDDGQKRRLNFVKYLSEHNVPLHCYGTAQIKEYKGPLPLFKKEKGLLPYKYHFNAENNLIDNYTTEKLCDAILCECLCFYWGNPLLNLDKRSYVRLSLENFDEDMHIIEEAIRDDWWSKRLPYIREAKRKILNEKSFFPYVKRIIDDKVLGP